MNVCSSLFSASVTLAGFIAVFLVFRYRQIDTYVDSAKDVLRSLLKNQIETAPHIAVIIQEIGKKPKLRDDNYFWKLINLKLTAEEEVKTKKKKQVIKWFFNCILGWRKLRNRIIWLGLASIFFWVILSSFYIIHAISPCLFNCLSCSKTVSGISIGFFASMLLTLSFVFYSLLAKRPKPK
ncbi:MAG: hypothetical protein A2Z75_00990 [Chloroflexi bacterium RBG_13_50_10]|nr:MAG: hypothetical protein A2Z75_00990 [Chloroflexi bacterium RBG_13_50_10]